MAEIPLRYFAAYLLRRQNFCCPKIGGNLAVICCLKVINLANFMPWCYELPLLHVLGGVKTSDG